MWLEIHFNMKEERNNERKREGMKARERKEREGRVRGTSANRTYDRIMLVISNQYNKWLVVCYVCQVVSS